MEGARILVRVTRFGVIQIALHGLLSLAASLGLPCRDARAEADSGATSAVAASQGIAAAAPHDRAAAGGAPKASDDIIVTAKRYGDARVKAETEFNEEQIAPFGADSIQDLLGRMEPFIDAGGEEPVILIDGQPAGFDRSFLSYPAEALERLAVLAPEAAAQYGQPSGKRVVNLVLKKKFSSLTADAGVTWATRGGRYGGSLSAGRLIIDRPTRWNVQARISADSALRKSARNVPPRGGPADRMGYISSPDGAEIDPALSLAAGGIVTYAAIPPEALAGTPTLADFAATANRSHPVDPNDYETLTPSGRNLSLNAGATRPLGEFSASFSVNATRNTSHGRRGLPMASILIPASSPWSPFAGDVMLTRPFAGERVLRNDNTSKSLGASFTLSGKISGWQTNFSARYARTWSDNLLEQGVDAGRVQALVNAGDPDFNPYGPWDERLLLSNRNHSRGENLSARLNVSRTLIDLPAGPLTTNLSLNGSRNQTRSQRSDSLLGPAPPLKTTRERADGQIALSLPLSRREEEASSVLGDLTLDLSMSGQAESNTPLQKRYGGGFTWSPSPVLQLRGSLEQIETAPSFEQLDGPVISTISRIYDYSRQEMAEPVWIIGGNPSLGRGSQQNLALNAQVRPFGNQDLSLNIGYRQRVAKGGVTAFPELTPAIEAAFPERVTRDAAGRLIAVDARAVNIAHDTATELVSGITLRWQSGRKAGGDGQQARPADPVLVTASLNHHWRLKNELLIRPGVPPIDQLGPDGGQARHTLSFQATIGKRGLGASWNARWTGPSRLRGTTPSGDFHFKPSMTHNLSMHIEPYRIFDSLSGQGWIKNLKVSLDVQNLFDNYRRVTFGDGSIPAGYSRDEIDPLGRTVRLTIRKKF